MFSINEEWLAEKLSERLENLFIGLTGAIILVVGVLVSQQEVGTVLVSIGASLIASAVVGYLASLYLFKRKKEKEITETWGLRHIYKTRQLMNESCDKQVTGRSKRIDVMAFGLRSFRHAKKQEIEEAMKNGLQMRILTINPESSFLPLQDNIEKKKPGSTKEDILQLAEWAQKMNQIGTGHISLRYYDSFPLEFYFFVDHTIFVGPYQYGIDSQQTISMEYGEGKAYDFYTAYFKERWDDSSFCKDAFLPRENEKQP